MTNSINARELFLFTTNDGTLYENRVLPIIKNLQKHVDKGTFDKNKSLILWKNLANDAAKKYAKEFAQYNEWDAIFSIHDRKLVALKLAEYYEDHLENA